MINQVSNTTIGGVAVQQVNKTANYFNNVENRQFRWSLEGGLIYFLTKFNVGFDLAGHLGANDVTGDNVGGRFGVFIPVGEKDGSVVLIEPLIRVKNLFESGDTTFMKDNFAFGFNISVSLPAYISKTKNK